MAKSGNRRKENIEGPSPAPSRTADPDSYLQAAFAAYESGDIIRARRFALKAKEQLADSAEQTAARSVGKKLLVTTKDRPQFTAEEVVSDLLSRTEVPRKPYLFAGVALALIALMMTLAALRS